jgi:hypothetical protein
MQLIFLNWSKLRKFDQHISYSDTYFGTDGVVKNDGLNTPSGHPVLSQTFFVRSINSFRDIIPSFGFLVRVSPAMAPT